jgi:lipopolysaccharide transport system ATP-binding protein
MSSDVAISIQGLSKAYAITHDRHKHVTLAETVLHRLRHPLSRPEIEEFWALKDISLDVERGEVVGVIGRNGAGKSTLLKILSRITEPTSGQIDLYGRVGSLLEVGTGFHPELTGRENIFLNGAILGMTRPEIRRQFDAIVDFAGVEKFLDTPVKRFSSGMYVRLAFAVAAHLQSEILIIDEVLAVGDAEFQAKCLGKMKDVARGGRTVLFVSHHMQSVHVLCNKAMYLERGRCRYFGAVEGAISRYMASFERAEVAASEPERRPGTGELRFTAVSAAKEQFSCGQAKTVCYRIERKKPFFGKFFISCHVVNEMGVTVAQCDSRMVEHWVGPCEVHEGRFTLMSPWLKPGSYRLDFFICSAGVIDRFDQACQIEVMPLLPYSAGGISEAISQGMVLADFAYETEGKSPRVSDDEVAMVQ